VLGINFLFTIGAGTVRGISAFYTLRIFTHSYVSDVAIYCVVAFSCAFVSVCIYFLFDYEFELYLRVCFCFVSCCYIALRNPVCCVEIRLVLWRTLHCTHMVFELVICFYVTFYCTVLSTMS
jgi:hypothetical protein